MERKPYPLPETKETIQQLVGFQYATELYIKMGYYTIRLSYYSQDMATIITEFWKLIYNCFPLGMCVSGDTLQEKVEEILGDIEVSKTHIDDILVLIKE